MKIPLNRTWLIPLLNTFNTTIIHNKLLTQLLYNKQFVMKSRPGALPATPVGSLKFTIFPTKLCLKLCLTATNDDFVHGLDRIYSATVRFSANCGSSGTCN